MRPVRTVAVEALEAASRGMPRPTLLDLVVSLLRRVLR